MEENKDPRELEKTFEENYQEGNFPLDEEEQNLLDEAMAPTLEEEGEIIEKVLLREA